MTLVTPLLPESELPFPAPAPAPALHDTITPLEDRAARRRARKERRKAERAEQVRQGGALALPASAAASTAGTVPAAVPGRPLAERRAEPTPEPTPEATAAPAPAPVAERTPQPTSAPAAQPAPPSLPGSPPGFAAFALRPELLSAVAALGFSQPTPIQQAVIPPLLEGRDVIGQAQTGTGKTAAFALPLLQRVDVSRRVVQALVLVPTRELANQVAAAVAALSRGPGGVAVLPVYGGQSMVVQLERLQRGVHVVIGTPGRVMDHLRRGSLSLADVATVVLDEADEMLRMGFIEDVEWILERAPAPTVRQTALFSATLPGPVRRVADRHLAAPLAITIEPGAPTIATIDQRVLWASERHKFDVLCRILELEGGPDAALVFTRTRVRSSELADALSADGFAAEALHGDMSQAHRESVLRRLRAGDVRIVIATDVAARGLDVESLALVVNFDAPGDVETYVHRIGRTGRAGRAGVSLLFLDPRERHVLAGIQRFTKQPLREVRAPTLADLAEHRVGLFKAAVAQTIETADLDVYRRVVEEIARDGAHDPAVVAAAVAHLAAERRPLFAAPPPPPVAAPPPALRSAQPPPELARGPRPRDPGMVPLVLSIGRDGGVAPRDIVGAIANEAGIPGRAVGAIEIAQRVTFVDVHADHVQQVLERVEGATICGRRTRVRPARADETGGARRPGPPPGRAPYRSSERPPRRAPR